MIQTISNYASSHYSSPFTLGCAALCAVPALETALHALNNFRITVSSSNSKEKEKAWTNLTQSDLPWSILYGLCATNLIPGTAILGAGTLMVHSYMTGSETDAYLTAKCITKPAAYLLSGSVEIIGKVIKVVSAIWNALSLSTLLNYVGKPFMWACEHIAAPIFEKVVDGAVFIWKGLPIPESWDWKWKAITLLIGTGIVIKVVMPAISGSLA